MVQLVADNATGDRMVTRPGLREISTYAQGIGPSRERILGTDGRRPSALVEEAHRAALSVFCWTLRAENAFLPEHLRVGDAPHALGDALAEARQLLAMGVDGLITDSPDHAVLAVSELAAPPPWPDGPPAGSRREPASGGGQEGPYPIKSLMTTFSSRPGPTPITLTRAPESSSSRRT